MKEYYDSYYDYDFCCKTDLFDNDADNCHDLIRAFNGGGSGG